MLQRVVEIIIIRIIHWYYLIKKKLEWPFLRNVFHYCYLKYHGVDTNYGDVQLFGLPIIQRIHGSSIIIEKGSILVSSSNMNVAGINHPVILSTLAEGAVIHIKEGCGISGSSICAAYRIELGEDSYLGANSCVYDTDFHPLAAVARKNQKSILCADSGPVTVGKNVWIGANALVLKSVQVGDRAVIGAGAIVTKDIPADSIAAGNPAKVIRSIEKLNQGIV